MNYTVIDKSQSEIDEYKSLLKEHKKIQISVNVETIIKGKYTIEDQLNINGDSDYAKTAITQYENQMFTSGEGGEEISSDVVLDRATSIVGMTDNITDLNTLESNLNDDLIDLSGLTNITNTEINGYILEYYKTIINSIIIYRKIRILRMWSKNKKNEIDSLSDIQTIYDFDTTCSYII